MTYKAIIKHNKDSFLSIVDTENNTVAEFTYGITVGSFGVITKMNDTGVAMSLVGRLNLNLIDLMIEAIRRNPAISSLEDVGMYCYNRLGLVRTLSIGKTPVYAMFTTWFPGAGEVSVMVDNRNTIATYYGAELYYKCSAGTVGGCSVLAIGKQIKQENQNVSNATPK